MLSQVVKATIYGFCGNRTDKEIDQLYQAILDVVLADEHLEESEVESIKRVLWTIVCVREPVTVKTLAEILNLNHEDVKIMQNLLF